MKILGVHIGHDSSAALVVDGRIVADVAEERFTRTKHYAGLPIQAVAYCLEHAGLSIGEIDAVAIPSEFGRPALDLLFGLEGTRRQKRSLKRRGLEWLGHVLGKPEPALPLYVQNFPLPDSTAIVHVEHHLAHAASAYYTSGSLEKQLIVTIDGLGDRCSTCVWRGEDRKITPLRRWPSNASIGWFYSNITEALGWWHGDGEGKTMGLAPYGNPEKAAGRLSSYHPKFKDGERVEAHDFGREHYWNRAGAIQYHFDEAAGIRDLLDSVSREDLAAEAQRVLEEECGRIIYPWLEREGVTFLSCSGGVFLNVKLNQRIWESGRVSRQHIYPNAGDSGLAVGAALHVHHQLEPDTEVLPLGDLYWGPEYTDREIEEALDLRHLPYKRVDDIESYTAEALAGNKIVGWFQGRMESGPRALGNRSILMSANHPDNKDIINARVKFREAFRPFCPSLLWEKKDDYLENARDEFYMITSFTCRPEKRERIPAVVHADHTLRPQTVRKEHNPRYWNLIREFGDRTGEYLLLNTSFNVMGEPIVQHPREAIRCFYDNGLDTLVLGNYVLEKSGA